eukprot:Platyproteum_vivax@DN6662_c0_g1_i2.p1
MNLHPSVRTFFFLMSCSVEGEANVYSKDNNSNLMSFCLDISGKWIAITIGKSRGIIEEIEGTYNISNFFTYRSFRPRVYLTSQTSKYALCAKCAMEKEFPKKLRMPLTRFCLALGHR